MPVKQLKKVHHFPCFIKTVNSLWKLLFLCRLLFLCKHYQEDLKNTLYSYSWQLYEKQWSKCNSICEGKQFRKPVCVDLINGQEVSKEYCMNLGDMPIQKQECNTDCQLTWNIDSKSSCSSSCGKG